MGSRFCLSRAITETMLLSVGGVCVDQPIRIGATSGLFVCCCLGGLALLLSSPQICVNQARDDGGTALYAACANAHKKVVQLMLSASTSTNTTMPTGATPLMYAVQGDHQSRVRKLLVRTQAWRVTMESPPCTWRPSVDTEGAWPCAPHT